MWAEPRQVAPGARLPSYPFMGQATDEEEEQEQDDIARIEGEIPVSDGQATQSPRLVKKIVPPIKLGMIDFPVKSRTPPKAKTPTPMKDSAASKLTMTGAGTILTKTPGKLFGPTSWSASSADEATTSASQQGIFLFIASFSHSEHCIHCLLSFQQKHQ